MQESAATLISKPAELLNGAPVNNNRGNPFQVGCTVIDGGLSPRFFGCQRPDEKIWASNNRGQPGRQYYWRNNFKRLGFQSNHGNHPEFVSFSIGGMNNIGNAKDFRQMP
jgi:hypothetical protein